MTAAVTAPRWYGKTTTPNAVRGALGRASALFATVGGP
jgi:hypothetical protein